MLGWINLSDELVQILLLCVPLSGLLVFLIVLLIRGRIPSVATSATFSVTINSVGWQEAYVVYREGQNRVGFAAQIDRKGGICAETPKELSDEELRNILPNLVQGLGELRNQYLVYRKRKPQPIPADEHDAAIAQLRRMGVELHEPTGKGRVPTGRDPKLVCHVWHASAGDGFRSAKPNE